MEELDKQNDFAGQPRQASPFQSLEPRGNFEQRPKPYELEPVESIEQPQEPFHQPKPSIEAQQESQIAQIAQIGSQQYESLFQQPEQIAQLGQNFQNQSAPFANAQIKYAGFWIRLVASMADSVIVSVVMALIMLIGFFTLGTKGLMGGYILYIFVYFAYLIYTTTRYQATIGKKLVGIMVTNGQGEKATTGKIVLRESLGKIASSFLFSIGYLIAGFTERKRALHDMIADTVVVYRDSSQGINSGIVALVIVVGMICSGLEGYAFTIISKKVLLKQATVTTTRMDGASGVQVSSSTNADVQVVNSRSDAPAAQPVAAPSASNAQVPAANAVPSPQSDAVNVPVTVAQPQAVATPQVQNNGSDAGQNFMAGIVAKLEETFSTYKTYKGYSMSTADLAAVSNSVCTTSTKLDISPDGKSYVLHRPLCGNPSVSACAENGVPGIMPNASTQIVEKTYHCKT